MDANNTITASTSSSYPIPIKKQLDRFIDETIPYRISMGGHPPHSKSKLARNIFIGIIFMSHFVSSEFIYNDFHQTLGLVLNGDATTADCHEKNEFIPIAGDDTDRHERNPILSQKGRMGGMQAKTTIQTNMDVNGSVKFKEEASFGHRDQFVESEKKGCPTRLRITSSYPSQVGSIWYEKRLPVFKGFSTTFTFQVTDHSQICSYRLDPTFSNKKYESCAVHGGDGFAFVIHLDPNATMAIGKNGENLGYGGMKNTLAVEFDMWTNAGKIGDYDDFFEDHISIHSEGKDIIKSTGKQSTLGYARAIDLADGKKHVVKISYFPNVKTKYFANMTANDNLLQYLKDNGEGRRLGTLVVYVDDGLVKDEPILAIPLNLSILLHLPQSLAYVGFTGSTGRRWEKHDIISWNWTELSHRN